MSEIITTARRSYDAFAGVLNRLQSPLLLVIRLYWGWQFAQDGWGKLTHLDKVTDLRILLSRAAKDTQLDNADNQTI